MRLKICTKNFYQTFTKPLPNENSKKPWPPLLHIPRQPIKTPTQCRQIHQTSVAFITRVTPRVRFCPSAHTYTRLHVYIRALIVFARSPVTNICNSYSSIILFRGRKTESRRASSMWKAACARGLVWQVCRHDFSYNHFFFLFFLKGVVLFFGGSQKFDAKGGGIFGERGNRKNATAGKSYEGWMLVVVYGIIFSKLKFGISHDVQINIDSGFCNISDIWSPITQTKYLSGIAYTATHCPFSKNEGFNRQTSIISYIIKNKNTTINLHSGHKKKIMQPQICTSSINSTHYSSSQPLLFPTPFSSSSFYHLYSN